MNSDFNFDQFQNPYKFEDFIPLVSDNSLSKYEKIGFPDDYRQGKEAYIFEDIVRKLDFDASKAGQTFLEIGPGCSDLPIMIQDLCGNSNTNLLLVDSKEMLGQLPDKNFIVKYEGYFPDSVPELINGYQRKIDYILAYSNLQCVFYDKCIYKFIDSALSLLKPGGKMLIGDIPNISKRKRYFSSETGIEFHKNFMKTEEPPVVNFYQLEPSQIDDGIVMGIMQRYRNFGFETYLYPQNAMLPMYNRREDILICRT
jgi:hypothetical protein